MTSVAQASVDFAAAVESAVRQLVSVSVWGSNSFVSLPFFYPGGGAISVKVEKWSPTTFRVSDNGFAFREVESLGAERSFPKTANRISSEEGVSANRRVVFAEASVPQLAMVIAKVGLALGGSPTTFAKKYRSTRRQSSRKACMTGLSLFSARLV
jgi:hypothetical protein